MFRELRATAPQTYRTFRTSNGTADVLYVLQLSSTAPQTYCMFCSRAESKGAAKGKVHTSRMINRGKREGDFRFVKTTADVRQLLSRTSISSQTCEKSFFGFLEVNFDERTKC